MSITIFGTCRNNIEEVENDILYINNLLKDKKILYITHFCHDKIKYLNSEVYYKRKKICDNLVEIFNKHNLDYLCPYDYFNNELKINSYHYKYIII